MSYCRFSSDDFTCDVYVYEDCGGGWTTHVAGNRAVGDDRPKCGPLPGPDAGKEAFKQFVAKSNELMNWLNSCKREPIRLVHAGESFNDPSAAACADRLESLRALGYNVPQHAIDTLRSE